MRKYILSILVIVAFASYVFYYKTNTVPVVSVVNVTSITSVPIKVTPLVVKPTPKPVTPTPVKPTPAPVVPVTPVPPVATLPQGAFKDGTYTGTRTYNHHGYVQVEAVISGGKLLAVNFLEYPTKDESNRINKRAAPILSKEAVSIQSSKVDTVSGATDTSGAFRKSLESALVQAKV
jgi:uncharacterized protein with FMN-binding domain